MYGIKNKGNYSSTHRQKLGTRHIFLKQNAPSDALNQTQQANYLANLHQKNTDIRTASPCFNECPQADQNILASQDNYRAKQPHFSVPTHKTEGTLKKKSKQSRSIFTYSPLVGNQYQPSPLFIDHLASLNSLAQRFKPSSEQINSLYKVLLLIFLAHVYFVLKKQTIQTTPSRESVDLETDRRACYH